MRSRTPGRGDDVGGVAAAVHESGRELRDLGGDRGEGLAAFLFHGDGDAQCVEVVIGHVGEVHEGSPFGQAGVPGSVAGQGSSEA